MWVRYSHDPTDSERPLVLLKHQLAFAYSPAHTTFLASGWAGGKSFAGGQFVFASVRANPGCTGLVVLPTRSLLNELRTQVLEPMLAGEIAEWRAGPGEYVLRDGGRIVCLSGHVPERVEAYSAAWAYADEVGLLQSDILRRLTARVREKKAAKPRIGFSGVATHNWLKEAFDGRHDKERSILHARTDDNPFLPVGYLEQLAGSCPARLAAALMGGQFVADGASVFAEYDEAAHLIEWQYDGRWPVVPSIDWGARAPHVVFFQLLPEGCAVKGKVLRKLQPGHEYAGAVAFDELVLDGLTTPVTREKLCQAIAAKGYPMRYFVCDPAGRSANSASTESDISVAQQMLGVDARCPRTTAQRSIRNGLATVQNLLMPMDGVPRLYVSRELIRKTDALAPHVRGRALLNAITAYAYEDDDDSGMPVKDSVSDHAIDCVRYFSVLHFPAVRVLATVRQAA